VQESSISRTHQSKKKAQTTYAWSNQHTCCCGRCTDEWGCGETSSARSSAHPLS
jgi:hypothetical protein